MTRSAPGPYRSILRSRPGVVVLSILTLFGGSLTALATGLASPAAAVSGTALVNGDTVTGSPSVEQTMATSLGLSVTVVSGSTWDSMTAADFANYTVLIIGDPTCGALAPSVTSNRATWTSAVMATGGGNTVVGNRVVWGSAPVRARSLHPGADKGISDGIAFAAALAPATGHATGVYFDTSCDAQPTGSNPALVDTLNMLSVGTARPWTEDPHPTCGGSVSFIGTAPQFADITTSDFAGWQCSVREAFPTFETDFVPLAIATDSPLAATCGTDTTTQATTCGEAYFLAAGPGLTAMDSEIVVSPLTATNPVGTTHTITATVTSAALMKPLVGQLVSFSVSGANAGASGTCVPVDCKTDSSGKVTFTYTGTNAGDDTIVASFMCNPAIHTATATKTWTTTEPTTTTAPTTTTTTAPPVGPPGNIFQVELRKCTNLHVGFNKFLAGIVVHWRVTQHGSVASTGQFTTLGGGKKNHFITPPLQARLQPSPKGSVRLQWVVNGTKFTDTAVRKTGC
jgi:hypothetical protein